MLVCVVSYKNRIFDSPYVYRIVESIKNKYCEMTNNENWAGEIKDTAVYNYTWLNNSNQIYIAHALGGANSKDRANTISEMHRSLSLGLKFLEVDLWLSDGVLRCHHGPQVPNVLAAESCTLSKILAATGKNIYLILDTKTNFEQTAYTILNTVTKDDASRLIFQVYKPDDLNIFNSILKVKPFAGPILANYLSRRSLEYLSGVANAYGIRAISVPVVRLQSLPIERGSILYLAHPVHDKYQFRIANESHVNGYYVSNDLFNEIK